MGATGLYPMLKSLLQVGYVGPKMAGLQEKALDKQHGRQKEMMALLSGKQMDMKKELLDRTSKLRETQRSQSLQDMMLQALAQHAQGSQMTVAQGLGSGPPQVTPPPVVPGMGMVDILRMR